MKFQEHYPKFLSKKRESRKMPRTDSQDSSFGVRFLSWKQAKGMV
jgi:hypothetical protein